MLIITASVFPSYSYAKDIIYPSDSEFLIKTIYQPVLLHTVSDDTREKSTDWEITANRLPWKQLCFPPLLFPLVQNRFDCFSSRSFHPGALNRRWHTQLNNSRSCRKSTVQPRRANTELRFRRRNQSRGCRSVVAFIDAFREYSCTSAGLLLPKLRSLYT